MGRRATSTTKGGRYMNPADQERKVERRRELKKNKKQRQMVRQAVLKSKDPEQLIEEMEKLDNIEFNPREPPPISERVIQDKRNKLRETYVRVMSMYKQENQMERFQEVKKNLQEYDRRKTQLEQHYSNQIFELYAAVAVKFAREVDPGEIPLPDTAPPSLGISGSLPVPLFPGVHHQQQPQQHIVHLSSGQSQPSPFPPHVIMPGLGSAVSLQMGPTGMVIPGMQAHLVGKTPTQGILKKIPPGVPMGPPPDLSDDEKDSTEDGSDREEGERVESDAEMGDELIEESEQGADEMKLPGKKLAKVRFDATEEDELVEKDTRTKYKKLAKQIAAGEKIIDESKSDKGFIGPVAPPSAPNANQSTAGNIRPLASIPLPTMPLPPLGFTPRLQNSGVRIIPPPPAFMRGTDFQRPFIGPNPPIASTSNPLVISAGPVLSAPPTLNKPAKSTGPVIEAKAQLRNTQQEVTKFVPTGVKIKLERSAGLESFNPSNTVGPTPKSKGPIAFRVQASSAAQASQRAKTRTTDDAYDEFMKEMKDLM